jgi:hypothetical protein
LDARGNPIAKKRLVDVSEDHFHGLAMDRENGDLFWMDKQGRVIGQINITDGPGHPIDAVRKLAYGYSQ